MSLTAEDVKRILELAENSTFDELQLEIGDLKIAVSKHGRLSSSPAPASVPASSTAVPAPSAAAPAPSGAAKPSPSPSPRAPAAGPDEQAGLVPIKSPIVGIFYVSPEPGVPPFVAVGSRVDDSTTVGLVEVMKVFNAVNAGCRGTIARCLVENAQFVEFGQPLFLVQPD